MVAVQRLPTWKLGPLDGGDQPLRIAGARATAGPTRLCAALQSGRCSRRFDYGLADECLRIDEPHTNKLSEILC